IRDGEEAIQGEIVQPGQVRSELDHLPDRAPVAAEGDTLEALPLRLQDARRDLRGGEESDAGLLLAAPPEAIRGRSSCAVAAGGEPLPDLGRDQALPLEDADRVAAEAHEHSADTAVLCDLIEERPDADDVVVGPVSQPERRTRDDRPGLALEPCGAI